MSMHTLHKAHPLAGVDNLEKLIDRLHQTEAELLHTGSNRQLRASVDTIQVNHEHPDHRLELDFMVVASMMNTLQTAKNVHYDNSWSKRGMISMFMNVERKYERLDTQIFSEVGDAGSETFMDTLGDFAVYAVKMFAWYAARNPQAYLRWMLSVQKEHEAVFPTHTPEPVKEETAPVRNRITEDIVFTEGLVDAGTVSGEEGEAVHALLRCGCQDYCKGHPLAERKSFSEDED